MSRRVKVYLNPEGKSLFSCLKIVRHRISMKGSLKLALTCRKWNLHTTSSYVRSFDVVSKYES
jgi:hypothetical protein